MSHKVLERFTSKIFISGFDSCWYWLGWTNEKGYGYFWYNGKHIRAHRWSYEVYIGKIRRNLVIDHTCLNRQCVNPSHLEAVTQEVNIIRRDSRNSQEVYHASSV